MDEEQKVANEVAEKYQTQLKNCSFYFTLESLLIISISSFSWSTL